MITRRGVRCIVDEYLGLPGQKPTSSTATGNTLLHVNATHEGEWSGSVDVGSLRGVRIEISPEPWLERSLWVDYSNPQGGEESLLLFTDLR